ncbi:hypothetical protein FRB98_001033, partial [Tulasnella sp. 332]
MQNIGALLYALKASITRLYFDVFLREIDLKSPLFDDASFNIHHALCGLQKLEEFCSTHGLFDWKEPPSWDTLKRLAVMKTPINSKTLDSFSKMKALKFCIVHAAVGGGLGADLFDNPTLLVHGDWTHRDLEFIITVDGGLGVVFQALRWAGNWSSTPLEDASKGSLTMMEVNHVRQTSTSQDMHYNLRVWFTHSVLNGLIWDKKRE